MNDLYSLIINSLKDKNFRLTRIRKAIILEFSVFRKPQSAGEIIKSLTAQGLKPHKTSIYRELTFLLEQNIVKKLTFGEKKIRYELKALKHHHHAICENCGKIKDIGCARGIQDIEKNLSGLNFKVNNHFVEFFGLCENCQ